MELRYAYLIMVDANNNNNKFYEMIETEDGMILLFNGRVESSRVSQAPKPSSKWNSIYNSKIRKGYKDMSKLRAVAKVEKDAKYKPIENLTVRKLISNLQLYSGNIIDANYSVNSKNVTQMMVDEAQAIIDNMMNLFNKKTTKKRLNDNLQKLFFVIPRKMKNVKEHLIKSLRTEDDRLEALALLQNEQDILDSMAGKVIQNVVEKESKVETKDVDVLESLGLKITMASEEEVKSIKSRMFDYKGKKSRADEVINVYKVVNKETEKRFNDNLEKAENKKTMLMYHGSRNQNWMFILSQGLKIRPSNAIHTGSMFGDAIYGADANGAQTPENNPNPGFSKAYGYTSSSSAYWTNTSASRVYVAIMKFHVGNQKHVRAHDNSCYYLNKKDLNKEGFDSVYAHGRYDGGNSRSLQNSEFMIYDSSQVTINYLIELKG